MKKKKLKNALDWKGPNHLRNSTSQWSRFLVYQLEGNSFNCGQSDPMLGNLLHTTLRTIGWSVCSGMAHSPQHCRGPYCTENCHCIVLVGAKFFLLQYALHWCNKLWKGVCSQRNHSVTEGGEGKISPKSTIKLWRRTYG